MIRDALAKGISSQQWVENAVKKEMAKPLPKAAPPVNGDDEISLVLFSAQKNTLAQIQLTSAEFEAIQKRAEIPVPGCSLKSVLEDALHRVTTDIPTNRLEVAVSEANGLLDLLANQLENIRQSGCEFDGPEIEYFCVGIARLANSTKQRLYDSYRATHAAIFGKRETVPTAA
jgi:hypothetical protein